MNAEILTNTFSYPDLTCVIEWLTHNGKEKKSINQLINFNLIFKFINNNNNFYINENNKFYF